MIHKDVIIFHKEIRGRLQKEHAAGTLHHAYLFTGPRGIGKASLARWCAQMVQCEASALSDAPCGQCSHCRAIEHGTMPDVSIAAQDRNVRAISIREVRDAQERLHQTPLKGRFSILIFLDADRGTIAAQNALLKTLEEPHPRSFLILTATQPSLLLPTIHSRVVAIPFKRVSLHDMMSALKSESIAAEQLTPLVAYALGLPGKIFDNFKLREDAASILAQVDALKSFKNAPFWELQAQVRGVLARYGKAPDALPQLLRNEMALLFRDQDVTPRARKALGALWSAHAHHVNQDLALDILSLSLAQRL